MHRHPLAFIRSLVAIPAVLLPAVLLPAVLLPGVASASEVANAQATDAPVASFTTEQVRTISIPVDPAALMEDENGNTAVYWSDTYGAARSGGRSHVGVDMMGPKMTPLLAAVDGTITWMRSNGNNMLVITDEDGWEYWYIHLNNDTPGTDDGANAYDEAFGPGIEVGAEVVAGQVIGYLGDSGNAEGSGSHLHFEIEDPSGRNVNPTLSVDDALTRLNEIAVPSELVAPFDDFSSLSSQLFDSAVGRQPTATERSALANAILQDGLFPTIESFVNADSRVAAIDRLYFAVFNRLPDFAGYTYWVDQADWSLSDISEYFATSEEYELRFGSESYEDLLDSIYLEMFGREPDEEGKDYWLGRLNDPEDSVTPGTVVAFFSEGDEARTVAGVRSELVALAALFDDRMPEPSEVALWISNRGAADFSAAALQWFVTDRVVEEPTEQAAQG